MENPEEQMERQKRPGLRINRRGIETSQTSGATSILKKAEFNPRQPGNISIGVPSPAVAF